MGNPTQSLRALIRPANYLLWTVVSLSLRFDMYMFASWKQDFDYISHTLFQVNLNEATVVYLLRRRPRACFLKHLFSPPWTTFSTETSLVFSRRRPQTRPGCLRSLLLNRRTTTWNLFVLYNKETYYFSFFLSKSFSITRPLPTWKKRPFDVICCLYKMKQYHWLLCTARNFDWSRKITPQWNLTHMVFRAWILTAKAEKNCEVYKS